MSRLTFADEPYNLASNFEQLRFVINIVIALDACLKGPA